MFSHLSQYAKKKILGSQYIIRSVGRFVESIVCSIIETIGLGTIGYIAKDFLPGYWLDIFIVDIGFSVVYILFLSQKFRTCFHQIFEDPCQRIGRKILGLDIQDPWAFLKLKYTILISGSILILFSIQNIQNPKTMIRLLVFETLMIQGCVDTWKHQKDQVMEVFEIVNPPQKSKLQEDIQIMENYIQSPPPPPPPKTNCGWDLDSLEDS